MNPMPFLHRRAVLVLLACGGMAAVIERAHAQVSGPPQSPPRVLPAYSVFDKDDAAVPLDDPRFGGVTLVLVDGSLPGASSTLLALGAKSGLRPERLAVVVMGSPEMLHALQSANPRIGGATWYRAPLPDLIARLRAPGVPLLLGIDAQRRVVWQRAGASLAPERIHQEVLSWQRRQAGH
jgi:hypothetical protein